MKKIIWIDKRNDVIFTGKEWKYPSLIVLFSSIFFVLLTTMFGISIDTRTGETIFNFDGIDNEPIDYWQHNAMSQYPDGFLYVMILSYYVSIGLSTWGMYDYYKTKSLNINRDIININNEVI